MPTVSGAIRQRELTLDRIEHSPHVNSRWRIAPETVGIVGYGFTQVSYTGDEFINNTEVSSDRNYRSHYGYVGAEHSFRPDLNVSVQGGLRYTDFYKGPNPKTDS